MSKRNPLTTADIQVPLEEKRAKYQEKEPTETPHGIPEEILDKILKYLTEISDLGRVEGVNSFFQAATPWKNVRSLKFKLTGYCVDQRTQHWKDCLAIEQNLEDTPTKRVFAKDLEHLGTWLPAIWRKCRSLETLVFGYMPKVFGDLFFNGIIKLQESEETRRQIHSIILDDAFNRDQLAFQAEEFKGLIQACAPDLVSFKDLSTREGENWFCVGENTSKKMKIVEALMKCEKLAHLTFPDHDSKSVEERGGGTCFLLLKDKPGLKELCWYCQRGFGETCLEYEREGSPFLLEDDLSQNFLLQICGKKLKMLGDKIEFHNLSAAFKHVSLLVLQLHNDYYGPMFDNNTANLFLWFPNLKKATVVADKPYRHGSREIHALKDNAAVIVAFLNTHKNSECQPKLKFAIRLPKSFEVDFMLGEVQKSLPNVIWEFVERTNSDGGKEAGGSKEVGKYVRRQHSHFRFQLGFAECILKLEYYT